jgi:hypothetical protein
VGPTLRRIAAALGGLALRADVSRAEAHLVTTGLGPAVWARVVVRVGGSWIAATGLLLLGWAFRPGS